MWQKHLLPMNCWIFLMKVPSHYLPLYHLLWLCVPKGNLLRKSQKNLKSGPINKPFWIGMQNKIHLETNEWGIKNCAQNTIKIVLSWKKNDVKRATLLGSHKKAPLANIFIEHSRFQLQLRCTCWQKKCTFQFLTPSKILSNQYKRYFIRDHLHKIVDESQFRQMDVMKINQDLVWKKFSMEKNEDHTKLSTSSERLENCVKKNN